MIGVAGVAVGLRPGSEARIGSNQTFLATSSHSRDLCPNRGVSMSQQSDSSGLTSVGEGFPHCSHPPRAPPASSAQLMGDCMEVNTTLHQSGASQTAKPPCLPVGVFPTGQAHTLQALPAPVISSADG